MVPSGRPAWAQNRRAEEAVREYLDAVVGVGAALAGRLRLRGRGRRSGGRSLGRRRSRSRMARRPGRPSSSPSSTRSPVFGWDDHDQDQEPVARLAVAPPRVGCHSRRRRGQGRSRLGGHAGVACGRCHELRGIAAARSSSTATRWKRRLSRARSPTRCSTGSSRSESWVSASPGPMRKLLSIDRPLAQVEAFERVRVGVTESRVGRDAVRALGATAVPFVPAPTSAASTLWSRMSTRSRGIASTLRERDT